MRKVCHCVLALAAVLGLSMVADAEVVNLAANPTHSPTGPSPLGSDAGWGSAAKPWDLVDGIANYGIDWARGLAFTGGTSSWGGQPAGIRHAVIDFQQMTTFDKVVIIHHDGGDHHIPASPTLEYWTGSAWANIAFQRSLSADLSDTWAFPDTLVFDEVQGSKVRYTLDNRLASIWGPQVQITHGWIWEMEVYNELAVPEPSGVLGLLGAIGGAALRRRR